MPIVRINTTDQRSAVREDFEIAPAYSRMGMYINIDDELWRVHASPLTQRLFFPVMAARVRYKPDNVVEPLPLP